MDEKITDNMKSNGMDKTNSMILVRWLSFIVVVGTLMLTYDQTGNIYRCLQTLAIFLVYTVILTVYFLKAGSKSKRILKLIAYGDVIFTAVFVLQSGGVNSEFYIFYYFLIAYFGSQIGRERVAGICLLSIVSYSISCILAAEKGFEEFNLAKLLTRDFLMILATIGISTINLEVKRYTEMHKKEFKLARTDKLTGLANRHYFEQKLKEELDYVEKTGKPLNILLFDLDNFKKFNDTYGHTWGDKLLTLFSDIIKQNIRSTDIPVRYGGEEFLLMLRDLDVQAAKSVGDRIRKCLEKQRIYVGNESERRKVTVSCGVAQYPKHANTMKEAIDCADKALYKAKETGKNTVVSYDEMSHLQVSNVK